MRQQAILALATIVLFISGGLHGRLTVQIPTATDPQVVRDLWVDPVNGDDERNGSSRQTALLTLGEAWRRVPIGTLTGTGYRILLMAGTYPESSLPVYLEERHGTAEFPISIEAVDGRRTAILRGDLNVFETHYLSLVGLVIRPEPAGDAFHCERCSHILLHDTEFDGGRYQAGREEPVAHETIKFNQSSAITITNNDIHGAEDNALDFVAVQNSIIAGNRIHNAQDWCGYVKGGSADIRVERNEFFDCGTGGFTAGQGSGFQFLQSPWLHYEAYSVRVVNNLIHDTEGAGLGVNGGYNVLLAHNTLYRIGSRSHTLEVVFGSRSCDGRPGDEGRERCQQYLDAGGWGTTQVDDGSNYVRIPNKHVYVYNNLIYNPPDFTARWSVFSVPPAFTDGAQAQGNAPNPARADDDLQIRGNLIWTGGDTSLGIEGGEQGCAPSNPTCNEEQLRRDNTINSVEPALIDPEHGIYYPQAGGNVLAAVTYPIPAFPGGDQPQTPPVPPGMLTNDVPVDFTGTSRGSARVPGAFASPPPPQHDIFLPLVRMSTG